MKDSTLSALGPSGPTVSRRRRWTRVASWAFLAFGLAMAWWYHSEPEQAALAPTVLSAATLLALVIGPRLHRPRHRRTWHLMTAAVVFWLLGAAIRGDEVGAAPLGSDLLTMTGYLLAAATYLELLRSRKVVRHAAASLDGLVLCTCATLLAWRFVVEPILAGVEVSPRQLVFDVIYPVIDILLLLMLAQLSFTDASRTVAYALFGTSMGGLLVGDVLWNAAAAGRPISAATVNLPYLIAYGALGASMLHPSMRRLTSSQAVNEAIPLPRMLLLATALATPTALSALAPGTNTVDRIMIGVTGLGLSLLVLIRTARATNAIARQSERFEYSATHDELTGLPNRRLLMERMWEVLDPDPDSGALPFVFFLDLDSFKLINDSWGHEVGDELLIKVARRLTSVVGPEGTVARIGGDEFIVVTQAPLAPGDSPQTRARQIGDRLLEAFGSSFTLSAGEIFVTPSIGAAWPGTDPAEAERRTPQEVAVELLRDADTAMYEAKAQGRGRLTPFDQTFRRRVRDRLDLEYALRKALGTEQLSLAYQPLVDLPTGRLVGWEALARWESPGIGFVSPADFIPVAEATGLIVPFGEWALNEAINQLATWRALLAGHGMAGVLPDLRVAVNVAARQLRDPNLLSVVREALERNEVPPGSLCIEITESAILEDEPEVTSRINELRSLGAALAVDDFGTGYSALGYLKRFPFTNVKIDQSFVAGLGCSPDDTAIVKAIIAIAHTLDLQLVGEGIETEEQARILTTLGCSTGQGYLLGRPMATGPAGEDLLARALKWRSGGTVGTPQVNQLLS